MWNSWYYTYSLGHRYLEGTEWDKKWRYHMSGVPFYGHGLRAQALYDRDMKYMERYGMDWTDIPWPELMPSAGEGTRTVINAMAGPAYVSKNLASLYRDYGYKPDRRHHDPVMYG